MTKPLRRALKIIINSLNRPSNILEIGSRQEKNQQKIANLRSFFTGAKYLGVDMRKGPGVDKVVNAQDLPFADQSFDLVFCLETLEHAQKPWKITSEIERVLKNDGIAIISSQQNFPLHMHPSDYFRYTPYGLANLFENFQEVLLFSISPPFDNEAKLNPQNVVMVGWKKKNPQQKLILKKALEENKSYISGHKPYRHRLQDGLKFFKRGLQEVFFRQEIEFF